MRRTGRRSALSAAAPSLLLCRNCEKKAAVASRALFSSLPLLLSFAFFIVLPRKKVTVILQDGRRRTRSRPNQKTKTRCVHQWVVAVVGEEVSAVPSLASIPLGELRLVTATKRKNEDTNLFFSFSSFDSNFRSGWDRVNTNASKSTS